jgi:hypothetical protein
LDLRPVPVAVAVDDNALAAVRGPAKAAATVQGEALQLAGLQAVPSLALAKLKTKNKMMGSTL